MVSIYFLPQRELQHFTLGDEFSFNSMQSKLFGIMYFTCKIKILIFIIVNNNVTSTDHLFLAIGGINV